MSDAEKDEAITVKAERVVKELSEKIEHHDLLAEEDAIRSGNVIRAECNKSAYDHVMGACSRAKRKIQAAGFYSAFLARDGQDSALARLIVIMSEGAASSAERALKLDVAGREIELGLAARLALTVSTLSDALDRHRSRTPKGSL
jgi:hypothetical protein